MLTSSQHLLFFTLLLLGTLTTISAPSWFMAWIGLELNLMSFIPLLTSKSDQFSSEAALKYFLVQALGSALIILAGPLLPTADSFSLLLLLSLLLKLGAAPFHFWFPPVMEGLNWSKCIILMTVQKVGPMFLISHLASDPRTHNLILISAFLSALFGALGGLNQTSLRKILSFSSINHLGWMLVALVLSDYSWISYFMFYAAISASLAMYFSEKQLFYFPHTPLSAGNHKAPSILSALALLSLGGLPPFSGFIPKWIIIEMMISKGMIFLLMALILSAMVTLYFYLRLATVSLLLKTSKKKSFLSSSGPAFSSGPLLSLNLFFLFVPSLVALF